NASRTCWIVWAMAPHSLNAGITTASPPHSCEATPSNCACSSGPSATGICEDIPSSCWSPLLPSRWAVRPRGRVAYRPANSGPAGHHDGVVGVAGGAHVAQGARVVLLGPAVTVSQGDGGEQGQKDGEDCPGPKPELRPPAAVDRQGGQAPAEYHHAAAQEQYPEGEGTEQEAGVHVAVEQEHGAHTQQAGQDQEGDDRAALARETDGARDGDGGRQR